MRTDRDRLEGSRALIMGLGLHGGGAAAAAFLARRGARVTVTDLRDERTLAPSLEALKGLSIRTVLGGHREADFLETDLVVKNPGVPKDSPFLALARSRGIAVETDLSLFLSFASNPLLGVTGSKGKSTTAAALCHALQAVHPGARLGGNITVSPLSFLDELSHGDPVVLELSSWQLGDLKARGILRPRVAVLTVVLPDHQDKYPDMAGYLADKEVLFQEQGEGDFAVFNRDDPIQAGLSRKSRGAAHYFSGAPLPPTLSGAWLEPGGGMIRIKGWEPSILFHDPLRAAGEHNRMNLLAAGLAAALYGLEPEKIAERLASFGGLEHRLELFHVSGGVSFYNDSAATIPQATAAALASLKSPIILIAGGTDKNLDFTCLREPLHKAARIVLLEGSAFPKIQALCAQAGLPFLGPFAGLEEALETACRGIAPGSSVLFSPGCTSFGMFLNEFDRGRKFKALASRY